MYEADAILKVGDAICVRVPEFYVVVAGLAKGAVQCREIVLFNVGVISPAAELITIMHSDDEFDIYEDR